MKNKKVVLIIVGIAIVAVGAYFLLARKSPTSPSSPNNESEEMTEVKGSIKGLLSKGKSQKCVFENESGSGTLYFSSTGKMRGDFDATVDEKPTKTHMIVDGTTSYIWVEGEKMGFKTVFDTSDMDVDTSDLETTVQSGSIDADTEANYKCGLWITDTSKFSPPSEVDFQSFETMYTSGGE